jgi:hypothetical protein
MQPVLENRAALIKASETRFFSKTHPAFQPCAEKRRANVFVFPKSCLYGDLCSYLSSFAVLLLVIAMLQVQ